jgi:outer membrane protein insertion porin family
MELPEIYSILWDRSSKGTNPMFQHGSEFEYFSKVNPPYSLFNGVNYALRIREE